MVSLRVVSITLLLGFAVTAAAEPGVDASSYFPLSEGREWEYSLVKDRLVRYTAPQP